MSILLAFVILAIYLLFLGSINRRRHPLMVYGPWDFVGVLFAASGFLLFVGPEALSVLNENWRESILFGNNPSSAASDTESLWFFWLILLTAYVAVVVGGSAYFLWRARNQTSIYNIRVETIETLLDRIFARLGLQPLRSGDMYYFNMTGSGRTDPLAAKALGSENVQTEAATNTNVQKPTLLGRPNVILEMDTFRPLWHVTLRWEPANSGVRQEIERELERELAETPAPQSSLGIWLTLCAFGLFLLMCGSGVGMVIHRILILNHLL